MVVLVTVKIVQLLRMEGWVVNRKKIERLWWEEGLQLPHGLRNGNGYIIRTVLLSAYGY